MKNIKMIIEFNGKKYSGWQRQNNAPAVQNEIEKALLRLTGQKISVNGSSRTDAGVHALGMCANFRADIRIPPQNLPRALNAKLPRDIAVLDATVEDYEFHARYSAKGKKYVYNIYNRRIHSPVHMDYCWHVPKTLDIEKMKIAAKHLLGKHDFSTFKSSGASNQSDVRTIHSIDIERSKDIVSIEISGDGFLYNMVRIIAGTLVDIGLGKKAPEKMAEILMSRNRKTAGKTAPANGLTLKKVYYQELQK